MATIFDIITQAIKEQLRTGRTQGDLAAELGVSQTTISGILRGTRRVGRKTAEAVLQANPLWLAECLRRHGR
jgi:transcriptional regulator with XRE-family HTH domain